MFRLLVRQRKVYKSKNMCGGFQACDPRHQQNSSQGICTCPSINFQRRKILYHRLDTCNPIQRNFRTSGLLNSQELTENEYEHLADETLDSLTELFEDLPERFQCDPEYDSTYGSGVLTVKISDSWGTYVINKQTPNKQIWLSSPKSGPKRYDFMDGTWIYKHDGKSLHQLLTEEISEALNIKIDFTNCTYGQSNAS